MKVLLTTMALGIGGAETHVVELAKALTLAGVTVTVASAGGVYVKELTAAGIPHVSAPLNRKNPMALLRAHRVLSSLIRREHFDIVHAHARIPALVCGKLQKKYGYRFVTTDHLDFKVNKFLRHITDWGEYTFVVSDDLKQYLLQQYALNPAHIGLTVNGIDTRHFSPMVDGGARRQSFGVGERKVVLHVSRLDAPTVLCADALIDATLLLGGAVALIIVGDGTNRASVEAHAAKVNEALGYSAVTLVGAQTSIAEFVAAADIFVGPSRAAMEAMACGKPTVLAGSQGYGGIFNETLVTDAVASNFCFRGSALPTGEMLAADLRALLSMSASERSALGEYGRAFIEKYYSIERMMRTQLSVYERILHSRMDRTDILICGYYGYGNAGDEAILSSLIDGIRRQAPELGICVMSAHPKKTAAYHMVRTVNRFDLPAVAREMRNASLFLFGGGNLLQDKTSTRSLLYYCKMIEMAKSHGLSVMLYDNGIGPLRKARNLTCVKNAMALADEFSFRERISFDHARALLPSRNMRLTFDPAILTRPSAKGKLDENYFVVIPKQIGIGTDEKLVEFIRRIWKTQGLRPVILSLYDAQDGGLCRTIAARTGAAIQKTEGAAETVALLAGAKLTIASRLHGLIYATAALCPMMSISDDAKLSSYLEYIGFGSSYKVCCTADETMGAEALFAIAERVLSSSADIKRHLSLHLPLWRMLSEYEFSEVVRTAKDAARRRQNSI